MAVNDQKVRTMMALLCCMMMLTVEASSPSSMSTVQVDGDLLGLCIMLLFFLGCVVVWEAIKWLCTQVYQEWLPGASQRKLRRLQKLRDATSLAIEREITKGQPHSKLRGAAMVDSTTSSARSLGGGSAGNPTTPRQPRSVSPTQPRSSTRNPTTSMQPRWLSPTQPRAYMRTPTTPQPPWSHSPTQPRPAQRTPSPRTFQRPHTEHSQLQRSPQDRVFEANGEFQRICVDVVTLMRCEELREALRLLGLQVSGLKGDLTERLGSHMTANKDRPTSPTAKQYRYILWPWRQRNLQGRILMTWNHICDRETISRTIHHWTSY